MKRTILILTVLAAAMVTTTGVQAQVNLLKHPQVKKFLTLQFEFHDPNPTHQPEADSIAVLFRDILTAWESDPQPARESVDSGLKARTLELFYDNSHIGDEDSVDGYRMAARRYNCFVALALLPGSEYGWFSTFIEDARECVRRGFRYDDPSEAALATIDLVEILLLTNSEYASVGGYEIKTLRDNIASLSEQEQSEFTDWFIGEYTAITNLIADALKQPEQ